MLKITQHAFWEFNLCEPPHIRIIKANALMRTHYPNSNTKANIFIHQFYDWVLSHIAIGKRKKNITEAVSSSIEILKTEIHKG